MQVLPASQVAAAREEPVLCRLLVTDVGYFPQAADHFRSRPNGTTAAIVMVCTAGAGFVDLGRGHRLVEPGQAVVIPPRQPHEYGADASHPWTIWWMHVTGDDAADLVHLVLDSVAEPVARVNNPDRVADLIDEALRYMERADSDLEQIGAAGAAWHALTMLRTGRVRKADRDPVQATLEFLQEHLDERHSVTELAARVSLSPSHFAALFRRETGLSVLQYQIRLAMNRARMLLDSTDLPVSAVALRVGYADSFYFSRQFRAIHGVTPSAFRNGPRG